MVNWCLLSSLLLIFYLWLKFQLNHKIVISYEGDEILKVEDEEFINSFGAELANTMIILEQMKEKRFDAIAHYEEQRKNRISFKTQ